MSDFPLGANFDYQPHPGEILCRHNSLPGGQGRYEAWVHGHAHFIGLGFTPQAAVRDLAKQATAFLERHYADQDRTPVMVAMANIRWTMVSSTVDPTEVFTFGSAFVHHYDKKGLKRLKRLRQQEDESHEVTSVRAPRSVSI